jgi:hypothetical protein
MRKRYAGMMLPVCALLVLYGCGGTSPGGYTQPIQTAPHNAPITVADGSMTVTTLPHSNSTLDLVKKTLTISGGQACSITVPGSPQPILLDPNWKITSAAGNATITTPDQGHTIVAAHTEVRAIPGGAEFGRITGVVFSPARLENPPGDIAKEQKLACGSQGCLINYWVEGPCP